MLIRRLQDEKELFGRIAQGEEAAFRALFEAYKRKLYYFMLRISKSEPVAEELTQDVFLKLWTNRQQLAGIEHPPTYIFTIARHKALDHLRKVAREQALLDEVWAGLQESRNATEEMVEASESYRLIREAVDNLPPQKRLIFRLSRFEGMDHERIAAELNISRHTVNNHLVQSLRTIRQYLSRHGSGTLMFPWILFLHLL